MDFLKVTFNWWSNIKFRKTRCFCSEIETENNLTAAGTFHATKNETDINHVSNLTEKCKTMAAKLGYSELLSRLSSGDIVSNKIYYQKVLLRILMYNSAMNTSKHQKLQMKTELTTSF